MYAEVIPNAPVASAFHYAIPEELDDILTAGHLVQISFGHQLLQGLVVGLSEDLPAGLDESNLKTIEALIDAQPVLTRDQLDLAYFIANRYLAPLADCLFLMLPPGLSKQGDLEYDLADLNHDPESDTQFRLLDLIKKRGPLRGRQIERALPRRNWKPAATTLVKKGVLTRRPILQPPSVKPKQNRTVRLLIPPAHVPTAQFRLRYSPRLADVLDYLFSLWPGQPVLPDLLKIIDCTEAELQLLAQKNWITFTEPEPVVAATYPAHIMQKWITRNESKYPEAALVLQALSSAPMVSISNLQSLIPDRQLLDQTVQRLNTRDLLRYSVNPPRVILKLTGAQLKSQTHILRKPGKCCVVLDYLARQTGPVPLSWVYAETGADISHIRNLVERDLIDLYDEEIIRDPLAGKVFVPHEPPRLTLDQQGAWEAIAAAFTLATQAPVSHPPFLLHGVTGSGKTEIYLRAVALVLEQNRRALILVPEIALTTQIVQRFAARFPGRVAVIHSELTDGERYDTWRRCRSGAVDVLIGARSALFAPLPNIGLIVLDEEHDEAFQQDPPIAPYYHAREVAVEYARRLNAVCILGSATPDMICYAKARRGDYRLIELPQRVMAHSEYLESLISNLPAQHSVTYRPIDSSNPPARPATVIDMRNELRAGNRSIFSRTLQSAIAQTLDRNEQAILFLNRRGQSTFVFCRDCGAVLECSKCIMPLIYHGLERNLQCHHCGATRRQPSACPKCKSKRIKYFGAGTELVENELKQTFPDVQTLRWDRDTTRYKGAHEIILTHFREHRADVLIGTQMIAKGLDLPLVTLVGVVSADVGLHLPDFRSAERVFQVLTQVAGRAGRSALGGRVIIQSYQPEHYAIQSAAHYDYAGFFEKESALRKKLGYPPYTRLARLTYHHPKSDVAEVEARRTAQILQARIRKMEARSTLLIGPAPCFFERLAGDYRWQLILRGPRPAEILKGLQLKNWRVEIDPMSLL